MTSPARLTDDRNQSLDDERRRALYRDPLARASGQPRGQLPGKPIRRVRDGLDSAGCSYHGQEADA